jgi:ribosomal protein S18 acetylase RimI-like enzyme
MLVIRPAVESDIPALDVLAAGLGGVKEADYFGRCFTEKKSGKREIFLAEEDGKIYGYIQLNWKPVYPLFRKMGMPEIQDLNVAPDFRRRGIASKLIDYCEDVARAQQKTEMGISVGLHVSYGPAQRLYVKQGYLPDGAGAIYDEEPIRFGEMKPVDDFLTMKLVKKL